MSMKVLIALVATASAAYAEPAPKLDTLVLPLSGLKDAPKGTNSPHVFAGMYGGIEVKPDAYSSDGGPPLFDGKVQSKVIGMSADKKAAWVAADVRLDTHCGSGIGCKKSKPTTAHVTLLVEEGTPWQPLLVHIAQSGTEKDAAANGAPSSIAKNVEDGAQDAVKLFESTVGDPKALADSISDRKDAVLYGSASTEKAVGGAAMKATLKKWKLGFKVRDGIQAGATASKNLVWVAANVDATPTNKPDAKATPYRATFIYEQTKAGWRLVVAHFSVYQSTI